MVSIECLLFWTVWCCAAASAASAVPACNGDICQGGRCKSEDPTIRIHRDAAEAWRTGRRDETQNESVITVQEHSIPTPESTKPAPLRITPMMRLCLQITPKWRLFSSQDVYGQLYEVTGMALWALAAGFLALIGLLVYVETCYTHLELTTYTWFNTYVKPENAPSIKLPSLRTLCKSIITIFFNVRTCSDKMASFEPRSVWYAAAAVTEICVFIKSDAYASRWLLWRDTAIMVFAVHYTCRHGRSWSLVRSTAAMGLLCSPFSSAACHSIAKSGIIMSVSFVTVNFLLNVPVKIVFWLSIAVVFAVIFAWRAFCFLFSLVYSAISVVCKAVFGVYRWTGLSFVMLGAAEAAAMAAAAQNLRRWKIQLHLEFKRVRRIYRRNNHSMLGFFLDLMFGIKRSNSNNSSAAAKGKSVKRKGTAGCRESNSSSSSRRSSIRTLPGAYTSSAPSEPDAGSSGSSSSDEEDNTEAEQLLQHHALLRRHVVAHKSSNTSAAKAAALTGATSGKKKAGLNGKTASCNQPASTACARSTEQSAADTAAANSKAQPKTPGNDTAAQRVTAAGHMSTAAHKLSSTPNRNSNNQHKAKQGAAAPAHAATAAAAAAVQGPSRTSNHNSISQTPTALPTPATPSSAAAKAVSQSTRQRHNPAMHQDQATSCSAALASASSNASSQFSEDLPPLASSLPWFSNLVAPAPAAQPPAPAATTTNVALRRAPSPAPSNLPTGCSNASYAAAAAGGVDGPRKAANIAGRAVKVAVTGPGMIGATSPTSATAVTPAAAPKSALNPAALAFTPASTTAAATVGPREPPFAPFLPVAVPVAIPIPIPEKEVPEVVVKPPAAAPSEGMQLPPGFPAAAAAPYSEPYRPLQHIKTPSASHIPATAVGPDTVGGAVFGYAASSSAVNGVDVDAGSTADAPAAEDDSHLCVICLDAACTHALVHGTDAHLCLCAACCEGYDYASRGCPICRRKVECAMQLFNC